MKNFYILLKNKVAGVVQWQDSCFPSNRQEFDSPYPQMKTKFILHGGYATTANRENDKFFKEILKNSGKNIKILLVFFAKEKSKYPEMFKKITPLFEKNKGKSNISFEIASKKNFLQQVAQSDIIYLYGGKTSRLLAEL